MGRMLLRVVDRRGLRLVAELQLYACILVKGFRTRARELWLGSYNSNWKTPAPKSPNPINPESKPYVNPKLYTAYTQKLNL